MRVKVDLLHSFRVVVFGLEVAKFAVWAFQSLRAVDVVEIMVGAGGHQQTGRFLDKMLETMASGEHHPAVQERSGANWRIQKIGLVGNVCGLDEVG